MAERQPAFGTVMPDPLVWDLVAYVKSLTKDPGRKFGLTVSPQSPKVEQVPAEFMETTHP